MDGWVYRLDYTERVAENGGMVRLNAKAYEFVDTDEQAMRDYVAELMGTGRVSDVTLRRRLPMPDWEDLAL